MNTQQSSRDKEVDINDFIDGFESLVKQQEEHKQQQEGPQQRRHISANLPLLRGYLTDTLAAADSNQDGKLSHHEFIHATKHLLHSPPPDEPVLITVGPVKETKLRTVTPEEQAPVVLIHGLSGSQLLNKNNNFVWINLAPWWFLNDGLRTDWNGTDVFSVKDTTARDNGVLGVNFLDEMMFIPYMRTLSQFLSDSGVTASTYDFRMVPHAKEVNDWVTRVKRDVESLYAKRNRKVYLIAHSLGNFMTTHLLNTERDWAEKYIAGYIAVCPPFGGAGMAVGAFVQGVTLFVVPWINFEVKMPADYMRPYPSISWLLPNNSAFKDQVVLKYQGQNYTPDTLTDFMKAAGGDLLSKTLPIYETVVKDHADFQSKRPNVPVWLVTAKTIATAIGFDADSKTYIYEDGPNVGDRTVPYASLHACDDAWQIPQENKFEIHGLVNGNPIDHSNIVLSDQFLQCIQKIINP